MISLTCASCHTTLSIKEEAAGKTVQCPGCGQAMLIPDKVATPTPAAAAPSVSAALPTLDQTAKVCSDPPTVPPPSQSDVTPSPHSAASHDDSLTAFLAPALTDHELGRLGGFRILKVLGHGGMGVVFQGEDPKLGRTVAIKAMLPHLAASKSSQERFLREARAAAALEHDHIVPIFHIGEDRGAPFIVMPFLKGESLEGRLQRKDKIGLREVLRIGREIAAGLAAAHERGLIHRDIKPANVWLEARGEASTATEVTSLGPRVKILDFGLARANSGAPSLTQSGAILGTPAYMAPEQTQTQNIDGRADLFSLGVVLYRLCTGQLPFRGHDTMSTLMALATHTPPPPRTCNPDIPAELSELVMKLLAKDPGGRPASAREVIQALQAIENRLATVTQVVPSTKGKRRKPLLLALGGGLAAVVLVGIVLSRQTPQEVQTDPEITGPKTRPPVEVSPEGPWPEKFRNDLGMEFVLVRKGKFWMGGGGGKPGDKDMEIAHDFYLGVYEVTQEEWQKVMDHNPSYCSRTGGGRRQVEGISDAELQRFPVDSLSWEDTQLFLKALNGRVQEAGWLYRLPTEAEWEYACRGGPLGTKEDSGYDFYLEKPTNTLLPDQANFGGDKGRSCKVGSFTPNRLGLYDMHGNVWEWCDDGFAAGAASRVNRGGDWRLDAGFCRASNRGSYAPTVRIHPHGLRLARVPVGKTATKFRNDLGMEFVRVGKGKFWMGGGGGKPGDKEVEIPHDFYLGVYEVTQEEWQKVMDHNPSQFSRTGLEKEKVEAISDAELKRFPVEFVSWLDAQLFLKALNARLQEAGWRYRLPTEAEWEYACRGGPVGTKEDSGYDYYLEKPTNTLLPNQANFFGGVKGRLRKVGSFAPNRLGLYDMHGNVWEWCDDLFEAGLPRRVGRAGSWDNEAGQCRASYRYSFAPSNRFYHLGLRLARVPVGKEGK